MGSVHVLLLVLLVLISTALCKDDDITCEDVSGHMGKELSLTCRVSDPSDTCCMKIYKFMNDDKHTEICREKFKSDPCIKLSTFTCSYTANAMTTNIKFFTQTTCGTKTTEFTVNTTESATVQHKEDDTGRSNKIESAHEDKAPVGTGDPSALAVIISVLSCFIIIIMALILRKKRNQTNTREIQPDEVCVCKMSKHDDIKTTTVTEEVKLV